MAGSSESPWDIPLNHLFPLVLDFYRKEKGNIHLEYEQKVQLLALYKQEKLGPHTPDKDNETGYFDVVGGDRRKAWINLGSMNKEDAQKRIVKLLYKAAPNLKEYVLEQWKSRQSDAIKKKETQANGEDTKMNEQTQDRPLREVPTDSSNRAAPLHAQPEMKSPLAPAALWCSPKAARQFISQSGATSQSQLAINPGETVTIQVPTSPTATAIFWEFVTISGDIGFGLSFQRLPEQPNQTYPIESLLPIVRRDCSEDLVLGSHQYQLQGTYFIHFDNSHSFHKSKIVYYKVFYQKSM